MKTVFEASNSLEGHMIANLLEQANIYARVDGDFLQGGVGELQAFGLVNVRVNDEDYERAREIVQQWESIQAANSSSSASPPNGKTNIAQLLLAFILGVLVGVIICNS